MPIAVGAGCVVYVVPLRLSVLCARAGQQFCATGPDTYGIDIGGPACFFAHHGLDAASAS